MVALFLPCRYGADGLLSVFVDKSDGPEGILAPLYIQFFSPLGEKETAIGT